MGSRGVHSFENDVAREWAAAYRDMGLAVAKSTIEVALGDSESSGISADLASRSVAAVEAVAFALERGSDDAKELFKGAPAADLKEAEALIQKCNDILEVIANKSGLQVQWEETGEAEFDKWFASLKELSRRVNGKPPKAAAAETEAPAEADGAAPKSTAGQSTETDLQAMIDQLSAELQVVRKEMHEGFRRLAELIGEKK